MPPTAPSPTPRPRVRVGFGSLDQGEDEEELAEGLCCVGVPVRDRRGIVVAGLSVAMPKARFRPDRIPEWAAALHGAAERLSDRLTY